MKFGAIVFAAVAAVAAAEGPVQLTGDNFAAITEGKNALVKFYAPWCGHCKRLKPAFDQLGTAYEGHAKVVIGESDCTADGKSLCQTHGVKGYPTLKYFIGGKDEAYKGG
jgi:protein disulfide-isomerase A6